MKCKMNAAWKNEDMFIQGSYTEDLDIIGLHCQIMKKFEKDSCEERIKFLENKIELEELRYSNAKNMVERRNAEIQVKEYRATIEEAKSKTVMHKYLKEATEYLHMYKKIGRKPNVIKFGERERRVDTQESLHRQMIIGNYLDVAGRYVDIDILHEVPTLMQCQVCGADIDEPDIDIPDSLHCSVCGTVKNMMAKNVSSSTKAGGCGRNNYEDRVNFEKGIKLFQGKQTNKIPDDLYRSLDEYFKNYNLPSAEEIRARPLNAHGRREGTTRAMLAKALHDIERTSYYDDINLIGHKYWGWELPDISHLEEQIMKDYDDSQKIFLMYKNDRKSSLNRQYRLYRHLKRLGYPCVADDFKLITTLEIIEYYESMWGIFCRELGWEFEELSQIGI